MLSHLIAIIDKNLFFILYLFFYFKILAKEIKNKVSSCTMYPKFIFNLSTLILLAIVYPVCKCQISYVTDSALTSIKQQATRYTVKYGETVLIPCVIENRKQANVIWQYSKSKIPETLTVGYFYYRKDYRIRVIANTTIEKEESWNLEIRKVRFEDEGYYLCKVMAEPQSLKRVVYLKVEVDLKIEPINPVVSLQDSLVLMCNTSYSFAESHKHKGNHHHSSHLKLIWYRDDEILQDHNLDHNLSNNNTTNINYKIEHFTKPILWSRIHLNKLKTTNLGVYKCLFRNQSIITVVNLETGI